MTLTYDLLIAKVTGELTRYMSYLYVNFAYYLLLLIFGTKFDYITPDILQSTNVQGQRVKGQGHNVTLRISSNKR